MTTAIKQDSPCEIGLCNVDERHRQEPRDCGEHGEIGVGFAVLSYGLVIDCVPIDCELAME